MSAVGWIRRWFAPMAGRAARLRLRLEALEERAVPTTFFVTLTSDTGAHDPTDSSGHSGDLRYCITQANCLISQTAENEIDFALPGAGPHTITLTSTLNITAPVIINGWSQSQQQGYSGPPLITLDGAYGAFDGIDVYGSAAGFSQDTGTVIEGLAIDRCLNGVYVIGADYATIQGDYIGAAAPGVPLAPAGNLDSGILLQASYCTISDNVLSGNGITGLTVLGSSSGEDGPNYSADYNVIEGNLIGTNDQQGVLIESNGVSASNNQVLDNTISSNNGTGVALYGSQVSGTIVQGNVITGNQDNNQGELGFFPGAGVRIGDLSSRNTIGGTGAGQGNVIAGNVQGVVVLAGSTNNSILGNSIYGNAGPGIDFGDDGPTANTTDGAPVAGTPNDSENYPVITSVSPKAGGVEITGSLTAFALATYRIELFASPPDGAPFQGEVFLGSVTVNTDLNGAATFDVTEARPPAGWVIDATATVTVDDDESLINNTSEFSPGAPFLESAPTVSIDPVAPGAAGSVFQTVGHISEPNGPVGAQSGPTWTVNVDYGDGTSSQFVTEDATFSLEHVYAVEGSYLIQVTVTDNDSGLTSSPSQERAEVFLAGTDPSLVGVGESDSGRETDVSAPGVAAEFTHYGSDPAFLLVTPLPPVVRGFSLVSTGPGGATSTASYDVRGVNLESQDYAEVTFSVPAGDTNPQLFYFNGKSFVAIPFKLNPDHTITVEFTGNSTPSVTDLNGTVFTITAAPIVPTVTSVASAANTTTSNTTAGGQSGFTSIGNSIAAAVGAFSVGTVGVGDAGGGGGGEDDPTGAKAPTAVQEILGDLPAGTTTAGDAGPPPGTAVLSPSQATLPEGPADSKDENDPQNPMQAPDGPGALRMWLTLPADAPTVAVTAPGAVQRLVVPAAAADGRSPGAPGAGDLALAAGLSLAAAGRRPRKSRRYVGKILPD